jgi:SAM-dependent methyltransferase
MYQVASHRVRAALDAAGIELTGKRVLDIGPGFGYFIRRYIEWGANDITGWDITQTSVDYLQQTLKTGRFEKTDISSPSIPVSADYDLVSAISVIYHIVDESRFRIALENMCRQVKAGGHLLIVDALNRTPLPDSKHVHMRNLAYYTPILAANHHRIILIKPLYYVMSRSILPVIGPVILSTPLAIKVVLWLERWMEDRLQSNWNWLNIMITRKETD